MAFVTDRAASVSLLGDLLHDARRRLAAAAFELSPREAALLLGHVLGLTEAQVLARDDQDVPGDARTRFEALLERRLAGEPVAYLVGEREFWGRAFTVDRRVLVPRPETEHLVEAALGLELPPAPRILDVGTGCGAIAVTLALEIPGARSTASDLDAGALEVLRHNARRHGARVAGVRADLTAAFRLDRFDLVVSNPPYVDPAVADQLSPEVSTFEPAAALFADDAGRGALTRLLAAATGLRPGTPLLLEIGWDQADWLAGTVAAAGVLELVELVHDWAGHPRTAVLRRRGSLATAA